MKDINQFVVPKWSVIKDQLVLFRIEEFETALKKVALKHDFTYLIKYSEQLSEELENVDLDSMKETLSIFLV